MSSFSPYESSVRISVPRCRSQAFSRRQTRASSTIQSRIYVFTGSTFRSRKYSADIAAATALQALDPEGREKGILAGANVIMPNVTDIRFRSDYQLYEGKPCLGENPVLCKGCIERRITSIGETAVLNGRGDSPRWEKRTSAAKHASIG